MKRFKILDLSLQVTALFIPFLISIFRGNQVRFLDIYFFVGGWQVASFLAHLAMKASWIRQKERNRYGKVIFGTAASGLISLALLYLNIWGVLFCYLFGLLAVTPVFAIWYFYISLQELDTIRQRELIHLK